MSAELEQLLRRTASLPNSPVDTSALARTVRRRRSRRVGQLVFAGVAMLGLLNHALVGAGPVAGPMILDVPDTPVVPRPHVEDDPDAGATGHDFPSLLEAPQADGGPRSMPGRAGGPTREKDRGVPPPSLDLPSETPQTPQTGQGAGGPAGTPFAAWSFDDGFQGWTDARGAEEMGAMVVGQQIRTQEQDPRRGWREEASGHGGTAGIRGWRMNGAINGRFGAPWTAIPDGASGLRLTFRHRWQGEGTDEVEVFLRGDDSQVDGQTNVFLGRVDRASAPEGQWATFSNWVIVDANTFGRASEMTIDLVSRFQEPTSDCTSEPEVGGPCDLGVTIDDVELSWW